MMSGVMSAVIHGAMLHLIPAFAGIDSNDLDHDAFRIEINVEEDVDLGKAFVIEVLRVRPENWIVDSFSSDSLSPLIVSPRSEKTDCTGGIVTESIEFVAYAFSLEDVVVGPIVMRAHEIDAGSGNPRLSFEECSSSQVILTVHPSLDRENPGSPELPRDVMDAPLSWLNNAMSVLLVLTILLIGGILTQRAIRLRKDPTSRPHERARHRLKLLNERGSDTNAGQAKYRELSDLLQECYRNAFDLSPNLGTTEEFLAELKSVSAVDDQRPLLSSLLVRCDQRIYGSTISSLSTWADDYVSAEHLVSAHESVPFDGEGVA